MPNWLKTIINKIIEKKKMKKIEKQGEQLSKRLCEEINSYIELVVVPKNNKV